MQPSQPQRFRETLLVSRNGILSPISATVYEPAAARGCVFCLHDFAGNANDFEPLATALVAQGYRVVCPDMQGRGDSAYASDPADYAVGPYVSMLRQLVTKYWHSETVLVGAGWGALLALLLVNLGGFRPGHLVLLDLQPTWSAGGDPGVQVLANFAGRAFTDEAAAIDSLLRYGTFAGAGEGWDRTLAAGRFRQSGPNFGYAADGRLVSRAHEVIREPTEISPLLAPLDMNVVLLWGRATSEGDRRAIVDQLGKARRIFLHGALNPLGGIWFTEPRQIEVLLGSLAATGG